MGRLHRDRTAPAPRRPPPRTGTDRGRGDQEPAEAMAEIRAIRAAAEAEAAPERHLAERSAGVVNFGGPFGVGAAYLPKYASYTVTDDLLPCLSVMLARKEMDFVFAGFFTVMLPFLTGVFFQVVPPS